MLSAQKLNPDKLDVAIRDPFFIFEFHNFFDAGTYEDLDAKFPNKSLFPAKWVNRGGKSYMNDTTREFAEYIQKEPAWSKFYQSLKDPQIIQKLYELTHSVPSERPSSEKKPWRLDTRGKASGPLRKPIMAMRRLKENLGGHTPVRLTFEFSYLEAGCYLPPHTDVPGKLVSLMVYFPDKGVKYPTGSGTEFYRGKNGEAESGWGVGMMEDKAMEQFLQKHEIFYTSDFSPNKLVGFIKTSNSWHGLQKLNLPPNATRRSLNINYYLA